MSALCALGQGIRRSVSIKDCRCHVFLPYHSAKSCIFRVAVDTDLCEEKNGRRGGFLSCKVFIKQPAA